MARVPSVETDKVGIREWAGRMTTVQLPGGEADSLRSQLIASPSYPLPVRAGITALSEAIPFRPGHRPRRRIDRKELVTNCDRFDRLKYSTALPLAFTEHGAVMAASVLNSKRAVDTSVYVVRAFVRMRQTLAAHGDHAKRLTELERKYDAQFRVVFDAIRALMEPPRPPRRRIGF